jgi:hypothetical protein
MQLSENQLALGEIQIRFQIRSISVNQRPILSISQIARR